MVLKNYLQRYISLHHILLITARHTVTKYIVIGLHITRLAIECAIPTGFGLKRIENPLAVTIVNTEFFQGLAGNVDDLKHIIIAVTIGRKT